MDAARNRNQRRIDHVNSNQPASKKPTHVAYHVREGQGDKSYWTRIGAAWPHSDGQGFNVQLEVVPLDGRVSLRVATEKKQDE